MSTVIVERILEGTSRRMGYNYRIQLLNRGQKTRCGKCGRGIVMTWEMGREPRIRNCAVCHSATDIRVQAVIMADE